MLLQWRNLFNNLKDNNSVERRRRFFLSFEFALSKNYEVQKEVAECVKGFDITLNLVNAYRSHRHLFTKANLRERRHWRTSKREILVEGAQADAKAIFQVGTHRSRDRSCN